MTAIMNNDWKEKLPQQLSDIRLLLQDKFMELDSVMNNETISSDKKRYS